MWVILKMPQHHTGVQSPVISVDSHRNIPVILVDSHSEIISFETEEEALKLKEIFEANSDSGHKYTVKKY